MVWLIKWYFMCDIMVFYGRYTPKWNVPYFSEWTTDVSHKLITVTIFLHTVITLMSTFVIVNLNSQIGKHFLI